MFLQIPNYSETLYNPKSSTVPQLLAFVFMRTPIVSELSVTSIAGIVGFFQSVYVVSWNGAVCSFEPVIAYSSNVASESISPPCE